jgi:hypothetical protein
MGGGFHGEHLVGVTWITHERLAESSQRGVLMKRTVLNVTLAVVTVAGVGIATYADHDEDERVGKLMEKTHEGKRSAYRLAKKEAASPNPSWQVIEGTLPQFEAMSKALRESRDDDIRGSADGYLDAVKEMVKAARQRDAVAIKTAVRDLSESCGDCHVKGGVGGELDD